MQLDEQIYSGLIDTETAAKGPTYMLRMHWQTLVGSCAAATPHPRGAFKGSRIPSTQQARYAGGVSGKRSDD